MKSNLQNVIRASFNANIDMASQIATALPRMSAAERKQFVIDSANTLADAASKRYGENIQTYDGQRGIAFGVWDGERMVRTPVCDATRKWFQRNITVYFQPKTAPAETNKVWEAIVADLAEVKKVARKMDTKNQRAFERELADLIARYAD